MCIRDRRYTSRMRDLSQPSSINRVNQASIPLRRKLRSLHMKRFLAVCWLRVLAPRTRPLCWLCLRAELMASMSKP